MSHEHLTVDGTLLEAAASQKSLRQKDDLSPPPSDGNPKNPTVNFRGEKRSNTTYESVTDPDARRAKKSTGSASVLAHLSSTLMDNRHGLTVATDVRPLGYEAERDAAVEMLTTLEFRARRRTSARTRAMTRRTFSRAFAPESVLALAPPPPPPPIFRHPHNGQVQFIDRVRAPPIVGFQHPGY